MLFFTQKRENELIEKLVSEMSRVNEQPQDNAQGQTAILLEKPCTTTKRRRAVEKKGVLISMGNYCNVVKYKTRYVLFHGEHRNDPILQSGKETTINAAMRAVERFAKFSIVR